MKKTLVLAWLTIFLMSAAVFGSSALNKSHKGKSGKDGVTPRNWKVSDAV